MKILVFDTETTGLGKNDFIVELCWRVYDETGKELQDPETHIITPDGYDEMPEVVYKIHGISFKDAMEKGKPKGWVLDRFEKDLANSDYIVCHNAPLDKRMIEQEINRMPEFSYTIWPKTICTMNIWKYLQPKKSARLQAVYQSLFNKGFEGWHRAIHDVGATARVLFEYHKRGWVDFE